MPADAGPAQADRVTIVVSHFVDAADEDAFLAWQAKVTEAERRFPGFLGAELFRPVPGVQPEWTALYRYDSDEHVDAWLSSAERRCLLEEGERFRDFRLSRISSPFGSWFGAPSPGAPASPASWKTAFSVLVALYPTVVLLTLAISEIWPTASLWQALLLGNICSVSLLTWLFMPAVTRALRFWLVPGPSGGFTRRADLLGLAACVAFLASAALIFWLTTTQLWHLP